MTQKPSNFVFGHSLSLVALALTVQMMLPAGAFAAIFSDVQGHWAQANIQKLSQENVLGGYPDGSFKPEGVVTRAEFSAVLVKAMKLPLVGTAVQSSYVDVPATHWATPSIETVKASGLVSGYPGGFFYPAQNIKRVEAMAMLAKAAQLQLPTPQRTEEILSRFSDASQVPAWARPAVAAAVDAGIFVNYPTPGLLRPNAPATRAEVAVLVDNMASPSVARGGNTPQSQPSQTANTPVLTGRISIIPASTAFTGTLTTPISSEMNRVGDTVSLNVDQPLVSTDNVVIVPWGSRIVGRVTEVEPAGMTGKVGRMAIGFTEIQTPDGRRIPIEASIATEKKVLEGGTTKGRVMKALGTAAVGAGLGAALGTAMGPLSGGKVGKGAIYGTALGAGVGALGAAVQKGKEVVVTTGDKLEIRLDKPIQIETGPQ